MPKWPATSNSPPPRISSAASVRRKPAARHFSGSAAHNKQGKSTAKLAASLSSKRCFKTSAIRFACLASLPASPRSWFSLSRSASAPIRRSSRSEEHTSELQSRLHLVCRLLLEKKKAHSPLQHYLPALLYTRAA